MSEPSYSLNQVAKRTIELLEQCKTLQSEKDCTQRPRFAEYNRSKTIDRLCLDVDDAITQLNTLLKMVRPMTMLSGLGQFLEANGHIAVKRPDEYHHSALNHVLKSHGLPIRVNEDELNHPGTNAAIARGIELLDFCLDLQSEKDGINHKARNDNLAQEIERGKVCLSMARRAVATLIDLGDLGRHLEQQGLLKGQFGDDYHQLAIDYVLKEYGLTVVAEFSTAAPGASERGDNKPVPRGKMH